MKLWKVSTESLFFSAATLAALTLLGVLIHALVLVMTLPIFSMMLAVGSVVYGLAVYYEHFI